MYELMLTQEEILVLRKELRGLLESTCPKEVLDVHYEELEIVDPNLFEGDTDEIKIIQTLILKLDSF